MVPPVADAPREPVQIRSDGDGAWKVALEQGSSYGKVAIKGAAAFEAGAAIALSAIAVLMQFGVTAVALLVLAVTAAAPPAEAADAAYQNNMRTARILMSRGDAARALNIGKHTKQTR